MPVTAVNDVLAGRYRLVRLLGRGGMSDVYEAFDESTGRGVAVKIVRSSDPEFGRRLAQEARALESFEHPGLIRLLDIGSVDDQPFLVMELIVGRTLSERLREGPLTSRETADLGTRLADALAYVHHRGVIHRDVKPSNILLSATGEAWLGDFGIAKLHEASAMTSTGATMGTVSYMAPEQLEDSQVGPSADIWSLGVILLECLTGQRVYEGTPSEVLARRLAGPIVLPAELPVPWKLVLTGMLSLRPDQRLRDLDVSALLATSAYDAPWQGLDSDVTTRGTTSRPEDRTAFMPGAAGGRPSDETQVMKSAATTIEREARYPWSNRVLAVAAILIVLGFGSYFLFGSGFGTTATTTTTTTKPPTTTTSVPPGGAALDALKSQVLAGESAGNVEEASGETIVQQASLAQAAYATGKTQQATIDLELAESAITNGVSNHLIGPVEGQVLQSDLGLFAGALGLSSAVTTTTTTSSTTTTSTTTTTTFPSPTFGNGNGN
jgi:eukaryotic-like serine/threonine-protein kinase